MAAVLMSVPTMLTCAPGWPHSSTASLTTIRSVYTSSPVEHPALQMRTRRLRRSNSGRMVLPSTLKWLISRKKYVSFVLTASMKLCSSSSPAAPETSTR